jgi:hypothetical protein
MLHNPSAICKASIGHQPDVVEVDGPFAATVFQDPFQPDDLGQIQSIVGLAEILQIDAQGLPAQGWLELMDRSFLLQQFEKAKILKP